LINAGALAGSTDGLQGNITNNGKLIFDQGTNGSYAGMLSGSGAVNKAGPGDVTFTGDNSYTGSTWIQFGTLNLDAILGAAKNTTSVTVSTGATLLLSRSDQVNNSASVTLSGGTITRGSGVSEVFGDLNLTDASFLNFGTGTAGTMTFGTYTPSALLTINNFGPGNKLQFGNTISSMDLNNTNLFQFSNGFTTGTESGTFTITAIPEPSTYLAAAGLLALMLWPSRHRLRGKVS
jgi:autotransporter-associated beta strand protein